MKLDESTMRMIKELAIEARNAEKGKFNDWRVMETEKDEIQLYWDRFVTVSRIFDIREYEIMEFLNGDSDEALEDMELDEFLGRFGDPYTYEAEYYNWRYTEEELQEMARDAELEQIQPSRDEYYPPDPLVWEK